MRIFVATKKRSWCKSIKGVDLTAGGEWAVKGGSLPCMEGRFSVAGQEETGHLYEIDVPAPNEIFMISYLSGTSWDSERCAALVRAANENAVATASGHAYGTVVVEGGEIIFFASDRNHAHIERLRSLGIVFDIELLRKARDPVFSCALAYDRIRAESPRLPSLPEGWTWGPEVSGVQFARREGHAELLFPTQAFLPAAFLRDQAKRLRALARVMETVAEISEEV